MAKHYIFFTRNILPQPAAHLIHDVNTANAAANLGYSAILVYLHKKALNPLNWFAPFSPQQPPAELSRFYQIQNKLKVFPLPLPWPINENQRKWLHTSTFICKYYFPCYIFPHSKIIHTLDWNLVKTAIRAGIPIIYEREHNQYQKYDTEIVNSPLFQVAITVADSVKENMIQMGMPPAKIVKLHLSFNQAFLQRQAEKAATWRQKLLTNNRQHLVVYAGGMYKFKGVNLLIDVAKQLPQIQFAFAGGNESQLQAYRQLVQEKAIDNVIFLGYLSHADLPSLLQGADILAHPHLSGKAATFTSPLKFFEYLASGTPIVATDIPPLREFQPIIARWCQPDHPREYAHCLQKVLTTHPRKVEGYAAQINFARQFSWESRMAKIMSYVEPQIIN